MSPAFKTSFAGFGVLTQLLLAGLIAAHVPSRAALRERDTLVAVLLAWVVIVVAFFSASSGKRGLYVLPAVPALAMAAVL